MTTTKKLLCIAGCALFALATTPGAGAAVGDIEAGACGWGGTCTWVDNNGETHNCESNGNVAVILGNDNHVNYCHEEPGNGTSSQSTRLRLR